MSEHPTYKQLCRIAELGTERGLFGHYKNDLYVHDREELEASHKGDQFVWALKACGTYLARVGGSMFARDSVKHVAKSSDVEFFRVTITGSDGEGSVSPIDAATAQQLMSIPSRYKLEHQRDELYFVVDVTKKGALVAECTISGGSGTGVDIAAVAVGSACAKRSRDIEQALLDGVISERNTLFARINSLVLEFADNLAVESAKQNAA